MRKKVKSRLISEKGEEYYNATAAKRTVEKYWESKNKQYQKVQEKNAKLENDK